MRIYRHHPLHTHAQSHKFIEFEVRDKIKYDGIWMNLMPVMDRFMLLQPAFHSRTHCVGSILQLWSLSLSFLSCDLLFHLSTNHKLIDNNTSRYMSLTANVTDMGKKNNNNNEIVTTQLMRVGGHVIIFPFEIMLLADVLRCSSVAFSNTINIFLAGKEI